MGIFALLVNPRDGVPYYAKKRRQRTITIHTLADDEQGEGYFHDDLTDDYGQSTVVTDLPRVHTPTGVGTRGTGLGTVLYTGLCAAAHQNYLGHLSLSGVDLSGDGVSSNDSRSDSAARWWTNARRLYGLVERVTGCAEESFEDESFQDRNAVREIVQAEKGEGASVSDYSLTASGTIEQCGLEADAYPYPHAARAGLVVALFNDDVRASWAGVDVGAVASDVNVAALVALNMGAVMRLAPEDEYRAHRIAEHLIRLAAEHGASRADVEGMRLRYVTGMDIDAAATWRYPDFASYSPVRTNPAWPYPVRWEAPPTARPNPARPSRSKRGKPPRSSRPRVLVPYVHPPTLLVPRGLPPVAPRFYVAARRNPAPDPRQVQRELARLHEMRARLGWSVFAAETNPP